MDPDSIKHTITVDILSIIIITAVVVSNLVLYANTDHEISFKNFTEKIKPPFIFI